MGNTYMKIKYSSEESTHVEFRKIKTKLASFREIIFNRQMREKILTKDLVMHGMRDRAQLMLRKKRYIDKEMKKIESIITHMEQLVHNYNFEEVQMEIISEVKIVYASMKMIHPVISIPDVERLLESTRDGLKKYNQLSKMLDGLLSYFDELDVADELISMISKELKRRSMLPRHENEFLSPSQDYNLTILASSTFYTYNQH